MSPNSKTIEATPTSLASAAPVKFVTTKTGGLVPQPVRGISSFRVSGSALGVWGSQRVLYVGLFECLSTNDGPGLRRKSLGRAVVISSQTGAILHVYNPACMPTRSGNISSTCYNLIRSYRISILGTLQNASTDCACQYMTAICGLCA